MPRTRTTTPTIDIRNRVTALRYVRPADLADHPQQWRIHGELQQQAMQGLLQDIGIAGALLAYESPTTGLTSIDGHLRKSLADTLWPTLILDVTDEEARLLLASYDPISAMAETNRTQLAALLADVTSGEAGVQALLTQLAETSGIAALTDDTPLVDVEPEVDRAEELRQQYGVEVGQVWACGRHRVVCGDCTDKAVVDRVMAGTQPCLLINDPPYGISYEPNHDPKRDKKVYNGATRQNVKYQTMIIGDGSPYDPGPIMAYFTDVRAQFWWGADYYAEKIPRRLDGSWLVWDKRHTIEDIAFNSSHFEMCWSKTPHLREFIRCKWFGIQGTEQQDVRYRLHTTQKPLQVIRWILEKYGEDNGVVGDLYLGSGTTLIACEQLGRVCRGVELSPAYVAVTLHRWATLTGETPVLLEG